MWRRRIWIHRAGHEHYVSLYGPGDPLADYGGFTDPGFMLASGGLADPQVMADLREMLGEVEGIGHGLDGIEDLAVIERLAAHAGHGAVQVQHAAASGSKTLDPEIEALDLAPTAKKAAYELKRQFPDIKFTSGRRSLEGQAHAMASNVVKNRQWIGETYAKSTASTKCQKWVDDHPEAKTQKAITEGLTGVLKSLTDDDLAHLSKHLAGEAFDVQPVTKNAAAIKKAIRKLPGLGKFLDKEGGLVRWHAHF
jgi:hypothetical protein